MAYLCIILVLQWYEPMQYVSTVGLLLTPWVKYKSSFIPSVKPLLKVVPLFYQPSLVPLNTAGWKAAPNKTRHLLISADFTLLLFLLLSTLLFIFTGTVISKKCSSVQEAAGATRKMGLTFKTYIWNKSLILSSH